MILGKMNTLNLLYIMVVDLLLLCSGVLAQPNSPPQGSQPYATFSPSMAIIIVILIAALFFMGFFSIYIRRFTTSDGGSLRQALSMRRLGARATAASRGLDAAVIETFPTFAYSTVKGLKIGKGALECAVCLNEFEDEETLRLIPKCDHVFHPECIDAWLESHVTCPVCRADLADYVPTAADHQPDTTAANDGEVDSVSIPIDEVNVNPPEEQLSRNPTLKGNRSRSVRPRLLGKFRSHSTGHSLSVVQPGENTDRYTLRLPEEVRKQVMARARLNRTASTLVVLPREGSSRKGFRIGEGSGRGRSYRRMESLERGARSDRWIFSRAPSFLTRAFSLRSPRVVTNNGEASTSAATPSKPVDMIPLSDAGPKSDAVEPAHLPV